MELSTKTVSTEKMRAIYEYAKNKGYEYEDLSFNSKSDKFFSAYKRKVIDEDRHIYLQYKLNNCLITAGKHLMSITITFYNKSSKIGRIEVVMPIENESDLDRAEQQEDAIIKIAKNCGII